MRVLALDYGSKRIGRALSDPLGMLATPQVPLVRTGRAEDIEALAVYVAENEVEQVVVGVPYDQYGEVGAAAKNVLAFVELLRARLCRVSGDATDEPSQLSMPRDASRASSDATPPLNVPVATWDERFSTAEAERHLIAVDTRRERRKELIDGVAAALILQGYLDSIRHRASPEDDE